MSTPRRWQPQPSPRPGEPGDALVAVPAVGLVLLLAVLSAVAVLPRPAPVAEVGGAHDGAVLPNRVVAYPSWTPLLAEGPPLGRAAYVVEQNEGFVVVGVDGSARRLPPPEQHFRVTAPALSPDGSKLAYGWSAPESMAGVNPELAGQASLRVVDLRTGELTFFGPEEPGMSARYEVLAWAPDAERIAAVIIVLKYDDTSSTWDATRRTQILGNGAVDSGFFANQLDAPAGAAFAWSPDGTRLAAWDPTRGKVTVRDAADGEKRTTWSVPKRSDLDAAAWSPDGESLHMLRRVGPTSYDSRPRLSEWVLAEYSVEAPARLVRERRAGAAANPWLVGWRGGDPVVELPNIKGVPELVVIRSEGPRHLVSLEGRTGGSQPSVASELLAAAPVRDVAPRRATVWSADALRWGHRSLRRRTGAACAARRRGLLRVALDGQRDSQDATSCIGVDGRQRLSSVGDARSRPSRDSSRSSDSSS